MSENNRSIQTGFSQHMQNKPLLLRLMGLSPFLAISYSLTLSLSMGVIFFIIICMTSAFASLTRYLIPPPIALACYVLFSATIITAIDLGLQAWLPDLRLALGIYLLILSANCLIIDHTLIFASENNLMSSLKDAIQQGITVLLLLIVLGASREIIGQGSLFTDRQLLSGSSTTGWIELFSPENSIALATQPAGGFIILGLILAIYQFINSRSTVKTA